MRPILVQKIACACGCGTIIDNYSKTSHKYKKYARGHNGRLERTQQWNGSRKIERGYWIIYRHSQSIKEHRLVYEQSRNCCLLPTTVIHHIDGKRGNNIWYNVQPLNNAQHSAIENTGNTYSLGRKHSEETKQKIGKSNVGKHDSKYWLGKHLSEETKKKISQYRRGRKLSQAHKDAIARGLKRRSTQGVIIGNE